MRLRARTLAVLAAVAVLGTLVPSASALPNFRDVRRATEINDGLDLCGTGQSAVNITGSARVAGDTWISVYDTTPGDATAQNLYGNTSSSADVLIRRFNNRKGGGLLALFNEGVGKKGLAMVISDAGNTDRLLLGTVSRDGTFTVLKSASLGAKIKECAWYQLTMSASVLNGIVTVTGSALSHSLANNPNSSLSTLLGWLVFTGPLPAGVDATGEVGIVGSATSAVVDTSLTNYLVFP